MTLFLYTVSQALNIVVIQIVISIVSAKFFI